MVYFYIRERDSSITTELSTLFNTMTTNNQKTQADNALIGNSPITTRVRKPLPKNIIDIEAEPTPKKAPKPHNPKFTKHNKDPNVPAEALKRASSYSKRVPKFKDPEKDPIGAKLDELNSLLPEVNLPVANPPKLKVGGSNDVPAQIDLDIKVEKLILQGETNHSEIARILQVNPDRIATAYKRVRARWQALGTFRDLEALRGERMASISIKLKMYWTLLNSCYSDIATSIEISKKPIDRTKNKEEIALQERALQEAKEKYNRAERMSIKILNDMHKWEQLYNDIAGLTTKLIERSVLLQQNNTLIVNGEVLTPDEQVTMKRVEEAVLNVMKRLVAD